MRNILGTVPSASRDVAAATVRTIFADACRAQLHEVVRILEGQFPEGAAILENAEVDVLAHTAFPRAHWRKIASTNPLERINKEIERRSNVVGIFPDDASVIRPVGAALLDQHDDLAVAEPRYLSEESMAAIGHGPEELTTTNTALPARIVSRRSRGSPTYSQHPTGHGPHARHHRCRKNPGQGVPPGTIAHEMEESPAPAKGSVLVVDDAPEFLELVSSLLRRDGYEVHEASDAAAALRAVDEIDPDLVVLDLTLPDLDGMEVCRQIRARSDCYVIMLTARGDEIDRVMGLRSGADDYVVKPFSPRELAARVEVVLRRPRVASAGQPTAPDEDGRTFGDLVIHPLAHEVEVAGEPVTLTRIEFDILDALSERPRMVHSRAVLRERVWGADWFGDDHVVDVHIANLRKKIDRGDGPSRIRTVRGVGYRMEL